MLDQSTLAKIWKDYALLRDGGEELDEKKHDDAVAGLRSMYADQPDMLDALQSQEVVSVFMVELLQESFDPDGEHGCLGEALSQLHLNQLPSTDFADDAIENFEAVLRHGIFDEELFDRVLGHVGSLSEEIHNLREQCDSLEEHADRLSEIAANWPRLKKQSVAA